jgi:hypothetical protein
MRTYILTIFALVLFASSCKTSKKTVDIQPVVEDTLSDYTNRKLIRDASIFSSTTEVVPLDTAYLSKDTLHLLTKKILGCDEETFMLIWDGKIRKSLPPIASVKLLQRVDPACKEQHHFHLTYNIKPLRFKNDSAAEANMEWSKVTVVKVGGWSNILKYEF